MRKSLIILSACALFFTTSCSSDYLDLKPNSSTSTETIFETTENVKLAVNGLSKMMTQQYLGSQGFNGEGTIRTWYGNFPGNDYQKSNMTGWKVITNSQYLQMASSIYDYYPWYYYYKIIGNANTIICRVDNATGTEQEKAFLKAQALTFRAYAYSQLVQLYSKRWKDSSNGSSRGVVLRLDESKTEMPTSTLGECYAQIYQDLDEAIELYGKSGLDRGKDEKYLPNLNATYAVYAKAALNREDWATAAKYAPLARKGYSLISNSEYVDGGSILIITSGFGMYTVRRKRHSTTISTLPTRHLTQVLVLAVAILWLSARSCLIRFQRPMYAALCSSIQRQILILLQMVLQVKPYLQEPNQSMAASFLALPKSLRICLSSS